MTDFEERLSAFLDRELMSEQEAELLHTLSVSSDKRALLHELINVRAAFTADLAATTVPAHLDAAVMAGITGMLGTAATTSASTTTPPISPSDPASPASGHPGTASWWSPVRRILVPLAAVVLFGGGWLLREATFDHDGSPTVPDAGVTSSIGRAGEDHTAPDGSRHTRSTGHEPPVNAIPSDSHGTLAQSSVSEADAGRMDVQGTRRTGSAGPGSGGSSARGAAPPASIVTVTRIDTVFVPVIRETASSHLEPRVIERTDTVIVTRIERVEVPRVIHGPLNSGEAQPGWMERFDFEVQREHATVWPYVDFARLGSSREQQHLSALLAWNLDDRHAIGALISGKSFAQEYYRLRGDSLDLFQQHPALTVGAGFYRYTLPVLPGVQPQAMIQLGATSLGPVLGARLGVAFVPVHRVRVVLGATGMMLIYRYGDKVFTSQSLGLTYGINVRL